MEAAVPVVFARVELVGDPGWDTYDELHTLMEGKHWHQHLPGLPDSPMPHAMYQGTFSATPDLGKVSQSLKSAIEVDVWNNAIVLLISEADWSQCG
jgi:hypothetical protein